MSAVDEKRWKHEEQCHEQHSPSLYFSKINLQKQKRQQRRVLQCC